ANFHSRKGPGSTEARSTREDAQLAGVAGFVVRLRAAELERRFVAVVVALRGLAVFAALSLAPALEALLAVVLLLRGAVVLRVVVALRAGVDLALLADDADELATSSVHLPDNTRCAASATASAISDPSFETLLITLVVAALALSAASMPASWIARRALGLAAIAAAAAVSPAAIISRLIAALAILSKLTFEDDDPFLDFFPLVLFVDLAITSSLLMTHQLKDGSAPKRFRYCRSTRKVKGDCHTIWQPPSTWSAIGRSSPGDLGRLVRPPSPARTCPTSLLNHETSDHLLSLRYCLPRMASLLRRSSLVLMLSFGNLQYFALLPAMLVQQAANFFLRH
ncbi:MAG: hypothetical protein H0W92_07990, partial [Sphingomonas sp.]|nr:hypothetical protein [Sphingomonas sp.]